MSTKDFTVRVSSCTFCVRTIHETSKVLWKSENPMIWNINCWNILHIYQIWFHLSMHYMCMCDLFYITNERMTAFKFWKLIIDLNRFGLVIRKVSYYLKYIIQIHSNLPEYLRWFSHRYFCILLSRSANIIDLHIVQ